MLELEGETLRSPLPKLDDEVANVAFQFSACDSNPCVVGQDLAPADEPAQKGEAPPAFNASLFHQFHLLVFCVGVVQKAVQEVDLPVGSLKLPGALLFDHIQSLGVSSLYFGQEGFAAGALQTLSGLRRQFFFRLLGLFLRETYAGPPLIPFHSLYIIGDMVCIGIAATPSLVLVAFRERCQPLALVNSSHYQSRFARAVISRRWVAGILAFRPEEALPVLF